MDKLNACLYLVWRKISGDNEVLSPNMIFGGYLIIFCGDFHQLPPVKKKRINCCMQTLVFGKTLSMLQLFWKTVTDSRMIQSLVKYWSGCGMEALQRRIAIKSIKGYLDQKFICQKLISMPTFHMLVGRVLKGFQFMGWPFKSILLVSPLLAVKKSTGTHSGHWGW